MSRRWGHPGRVEPSRAGTRVSRRLDRNGALPFLLSALGAPATSGSPEPRPSSAKPGSSRSLQILGAPCRDSAHPASSSALATLPARPTQAPSSSGPARRGSAKPPSGPRGLSSPCSAALGRAPCCALSHTSGTQRVDRIASAHAVPLRRHPKDRPPVWCLRGSRSACASFCRNSGQLSGLCSSLTVPGMALSTQLRSHISNRVAPCSLQVSFLHPPGFSPLPAGGSCHFCGITEARGSLNLAQQTSSERISPHRLTAGL